jgi:regulator of sirC expression with transglutaminase-like and TPR domain
LFVSQLGQLETNDGICNAATAIAMHFDAQVSPQLVALELDSIADQVINSVASGSSRALTAHLHQVLFDELGFHGDTKSFFDPKNSFLPSVLEYNRGIPITLSLVYKLVAERCGLEVVGLNTPGHFLVRLNLENEQMIIDCFRGGKLLTEKEVTACIMKMTASQELADSAGTDVATHRQWVARILVNLIHIFSVQNRPKDMAAVSELYDVLKVAY